MYYSGYNNCDMSNGEGVRASLFVSGCTLNCEGCFNKLAQNFKNGVEYTHEFEDQIIKDLSSKWLDGISILGGDPLEEKNIDIIYALCVRIRKECPDKDIWLWTGRLKEEISHPILQVVDVLIDGKFENNLKDDTLLYRGSSNQKLYFFKLNGEINGTT